MKFFAVNGSPRRKCNTAQLLDKSLEGVKSVFEDAETERIDLYDFPFHGCVSCFACKRIGGKHYGHCAQKDDLKPILEKITQADGVILGSPNYLNDVTGNMRNFLERFIFPFVSYSRTKTVEHKRMPIGFIYTMNASHDIAKQTGFLGYYDFFEGVMGSVFSEPEHLRVYETYQFRDYSKYVSDAFDEKERKHIRKTRFPKDLESAFEMGRKIAIRAEQHD